MSVRILHCSTNVKNYNICVEQKICGFGNRSPSEGDLIYLVVKIDGVTLCGARCKLTSVTDENPWNDGSNYPNIKRAENFEYCEPFDISILKSVGGPHWGVIYTQQAKPIKDEKAVSLLDEAFKRNKKDTFTPFDIPQPSNQEDDEELDSDESVSDPEIAKKISEEHPDVKMSIMGTFQAITFLNETDGNNGLEAMVNENFYSLLTDFTEENSVLIPENRLFMTEAPQNKDGKTPKGIRSIPDALLLKFDIQDSKNPIQVNLIEYECYGENKTTPSSKSSYLNETIIPQLMRFAAGFSIITDRDSRRKTIDNWISKIMAYIKMKEKRFLLNKMVVWIKQLSPDIEEMDISAKIMELLRNAFETNIRVLLVIDELSLEQKNTIGNVIKAFKLENGNIDFTGYVVSLVQRINIKDEAAEYALTVKPYR